MNLQFYYLRSGNNNNSNRLHKFLSIVTNSSYNLTFKSVPKQTIALVLGLLAESSESWCAVVPLSQWTFRLHRGSHLDRNKGPKQEWR